MAVSGATKVELLGALDELTWKPASSGGIYVVLPDPPADSRHAWTLEL